VRKIVALLEQRHMGMPGARIGEQSPKLSPAGGGMDRSDAIKTILPLVQKVTGMTAG
jgi:hypothetical protein